MSQIYRLYCRDDRGSGPLAAALAAAVPGAGALGAVDANGRTVGPGVRIGPDLLWRASRLDQADADALRADHAGVELNREFTARYGVGAGGPAGPPFNAATVRSVLALAALTAGDVLLLDEDGGTAARLRGRWLLNAANVRAGLDPADWPAPFTPLPPGTTERLGDLPAAVTGWTAATAA